MTNLYVDLTLDLLRPNPDIVIYAGCQTNVINLRIKLTENGEPYTITWGGSATSYAVGINYRWEGDGGSTVTYKEIWKSNPSQLPISDGVITIPLDSPDFPTSITSNISKLGTWYVQFYLQETRSNTVYQVTTCPFRVIVKDINKP